MNEPVNLGDVESDNDRSQAQFSDPAFPKEPFPCPNCGQMLAPSVRVCVACKQPIDPSRIQHSQPAATSVVPRPGALTEKRVEFPWPLFFILFAALLLADQGAQKLWSAWKAQLALGAIQLLSSVWVFFDAGRRNVPRRLRWAVGSLFLWVIIFPWYLSRRRTPHLPCPFVEAEAGPWARALFAVLIILFVFGAVLVIVKGPQG